MKSCGDNEEFEALHEMNSPLKVLKNMAKRPQVNIDFKDLNYIVRSGLTLNKQKIILDSISGTFRTGELTAILGPSGAGKSSLLNILANYSSEGVTGSIEINGRPRNKKIYNKLSCYIMQDDLVQPHLTVQESMQIAADLKLGSELKSDEKLLVIDEILETLGIQKCKNTRVEGLSGGQIKRLSVALELVNNPPVIFLDEPTSGLDVFSTKQLVTLMNFLARSGRTIICTIHQPSTSLLTLFDNVYFLVDGKCVYQGDPNLLVQFMSSVDVHCPMTHNPADFILETVQCDSEIINAFSNAIKNGEESMYSHEIKTIQYDRQLQLAENKIEDILPSSMMYGVSTSFCTQLSILFKRTFLQKKRNLSFLWLQLLHHIMTGIFVGTMFYQLGSSGRYPLFNFKFCICVLVFFLYTHIMIPVLLFPLEFPILKREHFNKWYGLPAYYFSMTLSTSPLIVVLGFGYIVETYLMSGQILDFERFMKFSIINLLVALSSEALGFAIGTVFTIRNGAIVAIAVASPLLALSVYGMGFGRHIEKIMHILMRASYLRYGLVGMSLALYENRDMLDCEEEIYCHYSDTKIFLRDLGMENTTYINEVICLIFFTLFHRLLAFMGLHFRLQEEFSHRIRRYLWRIMVMKRHLMASF